MSMQSIIMLLVYPMYKESEPCSYAFATQNVH
jgi:hypothetical protein